jgi:DNA-binding transcriptional LysR family regulator
MELRQLRYFVAVARELNFSRAARMLNISQPPLSYHIKQLELEIGAQLLERTKHSVELTPAGRLFLVEAEHTLAVAAKAVETARRASTGEVGNLTVSCMSSADVLVVPKVVTVFQQRYPAVHLTLMTLSEIDQVEAIEQGRVHVGFSTLPISMKGDGVSEHLYSEPVVVALPQSHPLAGKSRIPITDLMDADWLMPDRRSTPSSHFMLNSFCTAAGFTPRVLQYCDHVQFMLSLISAGVGIAVLPKRVELLPRHGVAFVPLDAPLLHIDLGVSYRSSQATGVVSAFLNVAREAFSDTRRTK